MRNQGFDTCTKNASERCSCALYSKNPQKSNRKDFAHFCGGKKPQPQQLVAGADHAAACRGRKGAVVRSRPRCRSSSTSAAFPSPPGSAGAGWSRCRHRQSRSLRSRAVSRGIRSRGQSPARRVGSGPSADAVRDVQIVVHAAQILDEQRDLLVVVLAAQVHLVGNRARSVPWRWDPSRCRR